MKSISVYITKFYKDMFAGKDSEVDGKTFPLQKTNGLRSYRVGRYLFIEQNPNKKSTWAELAREGHRILWVIDTVTNEYIFRVVDGKYTSL